MTSTTVESIVAIATQQKNNVKDIIDVYCEVLSHAVRLFFIFF